MSLKSSRKLNREKKLIITNNSVWENDTEILFLKNILRMTSIQQLDVVSNRLGINKLSMLNLKETLQINTSIQQLNLSLNEFGLNRLCTNYLKQLLEKNNYI